jgi:hypothetical protein
VLHLPDANADSVKPNARARAVLDGALDVLYLLLGEVEIKVLGALVAKRFAILCRLCDVLQVLSRRRTFCELRGSTHNLLGLKIDSA